MDVQSVSKAQKTSLFANVSAPADGGSPENAFSALLDQVGVKFNTGSALGGMESKLMHSNDAAETARAGARDEAPQNAPRSVAKAKDAKADDKNARAAKQDDAAKTDSTTATADNAGADAAAADQAQAAVQAAVAPAIALPVIAEVQAAPVIAAVAQVAATETIAAPVATVAQTAAAAVDSNIAAAATVTTPEQVAAAAPVIQKAAAPVVEQTKAADAGPQTFQATATAAAATDTSASADTAASDLNTVTTAKSAAKDETAGPKETRSAAAVDQSQSMSRMLGDETKVQVQVHVGGKAAPTPAFGDTNPYNIYSGYAGAAEGSTANGQVGDSAATNALVQTAKTADVQTAAAVPIMLPQLQSQQTQAPAAPPARADAPAPIQALEGSSGAQNNSQTGAGLDSFGSQTQGSSASSETRGASQTATERPAVTPQQIVDQIKVVITRAAKTGLDKVTIQLKPAELGRIDVKLEMSTDHKVSVTVTADNKETLALLQSDSHTLERTLNDAGLRTDAANLHFNLRSESDTREAGQNGSGQGRNPGNGAAADTLAEDTVPSFDYDAAARSRGGVDTFA